MDNPRLLLVVSTIAILAAPAIILLSGMDLNPSLIGIALLIVGALGLYGGMRALDHSH